MFGPDGKAAAQQKWQADAEGRFPAARHDYTIYAALAL
jgi:hypothetical protein